MWCTQAKVLAEAGFAESFVYLAEEDEDGEEIWKRREEAPSDASWLAYIVGIK